MLNIFTDRKSVYLLAPFNQMDLMLLVLLFLEKLFISVENLPSWHKEVVKTLYKRLYFGLKNILDWSEMVVAKTFFVRKKYHFFRKIKKPTGDHIWPIIYVRFQLHTYYHSITRQTNWINSNKLNTLKHENNPKVMKTWFSVQRLFPGVESIGVSYVVVVLLSVLLLKLQKRFRTE